MAARDPCLPFYTLKGSLWTHPHTHACRTNCWIGPPVGKFSVRAPTFSLWLRSAQITSRDPVDADAQGLPGHLRRTHASTTLGVRSICSTTDGEKVTSLAWCCYLPPNMNSTQFPVLPTLKAALPCGVRTHEKSPCFGRASGAVGSHLPVWS